MSAITVKTERTYVAIGTDLVIDEPRWVPRGEAQLQRFELVTVTEPDHETMVKMTNNTMPLHVLHDLVLKALEMESK